MTAPTTASVPATLMLEDGKKFTGYATGAIGTTLGEIVFNTCMTGYQEILTDPSYKGQIVLMTTPEIGNYGINKEDVESMAAQVAGFVTRRLSPVTSNWRANGSLEGFLRQQGIVGIAGVDTRAITRHIREAGAMRAGINSNPEVSHDELLSQIKGVKGLGEQALVEQVTTPQPYWLKSPEKKKFLVDRLVVVDFGIKQSILRYLQTIVKTITVVPASTNLAQILEYEPQGVLLSNGPGDPENVPYAIELTKKLIERNLPTFGICLGHQIISLACGATVSKMRFGHHGGNHPVQDLETGKVSITSQNHGYATMPDNFPDDTLQVTHINLNDNTIAGVRHKHKPVCSVQFHPEASPGPHDSVYLFERFMREIFEAVPPAC